MGIASVNGWDNQSFRETFPRQPLLPQSPYKRLYRMQQLVAYERDKEKDIHRGKRNANMQRQRFLIKMAREGLEADKADLKVQISFPSIAT